MKDKATKNKVKKPIYKKWWFWVIIVVILSAIFGNSGTKDDIEDGAKDAINSAEQQIEDDSTTDNFIEVVKNTIQGAISSEDESITDVVLKDGDLCISVDLSKVDPAPLTIEDLAISRTGSITDAILTLADYDSQWNTITIDFGDIGKIVNKKDDVKENDFGGRYFPSENFTLE